MSAVRRLVVVATAATLALPLAATADTPSQPGRLVLTDPSGDAGGLNDRGEGLVTNVRGPVSFAEADLTRFALTGLRDGQSRTTGFVVHFTSVGGAQPVAPLAGAQMSYVMTLQPTPDCRFSIVYTVTRELPGRAELRTGNSCSTPAQRFPLASSTYHTSVRIEVPYGVGPDAMRAGEDLDQFYAYTSDRLVTYDTLYPRVGYTLPR